MSGIFKHLTGRAQVRRPSEGGSLFVREYHGRQTLVDQAGRPIQLRGMSTHGLQWYGEITNQNAFAALANDWGCNVIRLAMYIGEGGYTADPSVRERVYQGIDLAFEHDLYVIVDWHVLSPGDPNAAVYAGAYAFFDDLSVRYQDHPRYHQIIWELCNEPNPSGDEANANDASGWQAIRRYAEPIIQMLRQRGDNIIIVGTPNWSQRVDLAADDPIAAENIMYAVHFYTGTHQPSDHSHDRDNVMSNTRYAIEHGSAVFASEWGTSEASGDHGPFLEAADIWLEFLNEQMISWCNWSLTTRDETSGSFRPCLPDESEAGRLDPGSGQVWPDEQLSVSGRYVRDRIKGL